LAFFSITQFFEIRGANLEIIIKTQAPNPK